MVSRRGLRTIIAVGLLLLALLLVAFFVVGALAWLLGAMGDPEGHAVMGRVAMALGILTAIDLIVLVLAQGLRALDDPDQMPPE